MGQINIIVDDQTKLIIKKKAALNGMAIDKYCLHAALNFNSETSGTTRGVQVGVIAANDKISKKNDGYVNNKKYTNTLQTSTRYNRD
jgi:hypothetical protein